MLMSILAFHSSRNTARTRTSLGAWGLQKLGQPVGINVEAPHNSEEMAPFGNSAATGSGTDERKLRQRSGDDKDCDMVSRMDGAFRRKSLLMTLKSETLSEPEKMLYIKMAADQEGLLPESFGSAAPTSMHAAGLMDEWNFEL